MSKNKPEDFVKRIQAQKLTIYDEIEVGDPDFWIPSTELESLLKAGLMNISLAGLANRTRSKIVKSKVCEVLGYPIPKSFQKTQPRFLGQMFDTYVQKSNNLQIWNEELSPLRRYVIISVSSNLKINDVRVVTGEALALLDTTGTLTQKYQARYVKPSSSFDLVSSQDTENLRRLETDKSAKATLDKKSPTEQPTLGEILPIDTVFKKLKTLVGKSFPDLGRDQERNRGADLHRLVCLGLGFKNYGDDGNFPDIRNQLIEVKLQTAPTIDLGLVLPSSKGPLDLSKLNGVQIRHCDVRYAVFGAHTDGKTVTINELVLTTGEDFLTRFPQFQGKVLNKKLQIRLPKGFFRIKAE